MATSVSANEIYKSYTPYCYDIQNTYKRYLFSLHLTKIRIYYISLIGEKKSISSQIEQVHLTDLCQGNETRAFHWLLVVAQIIVARLRRELVSLNENFTALFL